MGTLLAALGLLKLLRGAAKHRLGAQFALSRNPDTWSLSFLHLGCFLLVFVATGLGNGAVFQMAPGAVGPALAGPTVGWMSAVAAYGSFLIPAVFKGSIAAGSVHSALYGFTAFYGLCLALNGWAYLGWRPRRA